MRVKHIEQGIQEGTPNVFETRDLCLNLFIELYENKDKL